MLDIPESVRRQAMHPFSTLPVQTGWRRVVGTYAIINLHPLPMPQIVEPNPQLSIDDVDAAVEEARSHVRDHGRDAIVWLAGPDHPWLAEALGQRGLRNEDSSGLEATEHAMALIDEPAGPPVAGVHVSVVDTFEAYAASVDVELAAFDVSHEERAATESQLAARWDDYAVEDGHQRWNAHIGGQVVGTAAGVLGAAGVNLFGGSVLPQARGHGVYRALVQARWAVAVQRETPTLTVQAGRMSRPVLERLGFTVIAQMPTYVDTL